MKRIALPFVAAALGAIALTIVLALPSPKSSVAADQGESRPAGDTKVKVAGLRVARPDKNDKYGGSMAFGLQTGVGVFVRIEQPGRQIIDLDEKASNLKAFTDDKGTVLGKPGKPGFGDSWLSGFPHIADDHQSCTPEILSKKLPAAGARELTIQGTIALVVGSNEKTAKIETVLKKGKKVKLGPVDAEISEVGDPDWGDKKLVVTFRGSESFDAIREVIFKGPDGKVIESGGAGSSSMTMGSKSVYTRSFGLAKKVDKVAIEIKYFDKLETVKVPLDLKVGLGL